MEMAMNFEMKRFLMDCGLPYQDTWLECLPEEILTKIYKYIYEDNIERFRRVKIPEGELPWYFYYTKRRRVKNFDNVIELKTMGYKMKQAITHYTKLIIPYNYTQSERITYDFSIELILDMVDLPQTIIPKKTIFHHDFIEIKRCQGKDTYKTKPTEVIAF